MGKGQIHGMMRGDCACGPYPPNRGVDVPDEGPEKTPSPALAIVTWSSPVSPGHEEGVHLDALEALESSNLAQ